MYTTAKKLKAIRRSKTILCTLSFLLTCTAGFSQQKNYKITYRHCIQYDTMQTLRDTIGLEAVLIGNDIESNYSFAKAPKQKIVQTTFEGKPIVNLEDMINQKKSGTFVTKGKSLLYDSIGNMVYQNKKNKLLSVREKMNYEYVVTEETTPIINWEILNETKVIKTYNCKKAVAYFRGRYYTAWFTTDLPIVAAPWKFGGLPGLVMDIEDSKQQVKIYVDNVEYPASVQVPAFVNNGTKMPMEKYLLQRNEDFKKSIAETQAELDSQPGMDEFVAAGGPRPIARGKGALYSIEIRLY